MATLIDQTRQYSKLRVECEHQVARVGRPGSEIRAEEHLPVYMRVSSDQVIREGNGRYTFLELWRYFYSRHTLNRHSSSRQCHHQPLGSCY
jgi:hypothetical protein